MAISNDAQGVAVSAAELQQGQYSQGTLVKVLNALTQDGLVILKGVIPVEIIDRLNVKMCDDVDKRVADPSQEYNHGIKSNILLRPPVTDPEHVTEEVFFNPFLLQVANAYLGHRPVWNWLTANAALGNTSGIRQPVHKDTCYDHHLFPSYFIANIPLCDFSIENGATEFWLGSHAHTTARDQLMPTDTKDIKHYAEGSMDDPLPAISDEAKQRRVQIRPPIQPACHRGDIMIRDLRLWHAGMPNSSDAHRIMLGLGYQSPYHGNETMHVHLPKSQRQFFENGGTNAVSVRAKWYDEDELANTRVDSIFDTRPEKVN